MVRAISISVIIPAKNEEESIDAVLFALIKEKERFSFIKEIFLLDNKSQDRTAELAMKFSVSVLSVEGGVSKIRNIGAEKCTGDILAFVDGDCVIKEGWSRAAVGLVNEKGVDWKRMIFGSPVDIPADASWIEEVWFSPTRRRDGALNYINSGNMLIAKRFFDRLGGFDVLLSSSEDVDICQRAKSQGGFLCEDSRIGAIHLGFPKTLKSFFQRELWHGSGMLRSRGGLLNNKAMMLSVYTLCVLLISIGISLYSILIAIILILLYSISIVLLGYRLCRPKNITGLLAASILTATYAAARAIALLFSTLNRNYKT